jgi:hypothetical protein
LCVLANKVPCNATNISIEELYGILCIKLTYKYHEKYRGETKQLGLVQHIKNAEMVKELRNEKFLIINTLNFIIAYIISVEASGNSSMPVPKHYFNTILF